jgi:hypothetical protein
MTTKMVARVTYSLAIGFMAGGLVFAAWAWAQASAEMSMGVSSAGSRGDVASPARAANPDAALDAMAHNTGFHGFVHGKVLGLPASRSTKSFGSSRLAVISDYPLLVNGFEGKGSSPYTLGSTVVLRVPGGATETRTVTAEDAPRFSAGEEIFALVRDQGAIAGGNQPTVLVESLTDDIFIVQGGIVFGQNDWHDVHEPLATFEAHFSLG